MSDWVDVDAVSAFGPGDRRVVDVDDVAVLVINVDGQYFAVEDLCSHQEFPLSDGDLRDDRIVCSRHGAEFCLRTGAAMTAPAYEAIATFPVRIHDGTVQVRDDRWD